MNLHSDLHTASDISPMRETETVMVEHQAMQRFEELTGDHLFTPHELTQIEQDAMDPAEAFNRLTETPVIHEDASPHLSEVSCNSPELALETTLPRDIEVDDFGKAYKQDGALLPNTEYTVHGNTYRTDSHGKLISCDAHPRYTEDGTRNLREQRESGGHDRLEQDDGGHIVARVLGGTEGIENLVPMRRTINRGDFKKMENEIAQHVKKGEDVPMHVDILYDDDSKRPAELHVHYTLGDQPIEVIFDNRENSVQLLDHIKQKISEPHYRALKEELTEMQADGCPATITSVKTESGSGKDIVTIGILDETTGIKTYRVYDSFGKEPVH